MDGRDKYFKFSSQGMAGELAGSARARREHIVPNSSDDCPASAGLSWSRY